MMDAQCPNCLEEFDEADVDTTCWHCKRGVITRAPADIADDDYVISETRNRLNITNIGDAFDMDHAMSLIVAKQKRDEFYPNVWTVNDHGNIDLLAITVDESRRVKRCGNCASTDVHRTSSEYWETVSQSWETGDHDGLESFVCPDCAYDAPNCIDDPAISYTIARSWV